MNKEFVFSASPEVVVVVLTINTLGIPLVNVFVVSLTL